MIARDVWKEPYGLIDDPAADSRARAMLDHGESGYDAEIRAAVRELVDRFAPPPAPLPDGTSDSEKRRASQECTMQRSAVRAAIRRFAMGD